MISLVRKGKLLGVLKSRQTSGFWMISPFGKVSS